MKLKQLRKNENLSQEDLTKILGVSQATYYRYEQSVTEIPSNVLIKLADYFHVSIDYIVDRKNPNDLGYISEEQRIIFKKITSLSETNQIKVAGYVDSLVESEKKK